MAKVTVLAVIEISWIYHGFTKIPSMKIPSWMAIGRGKK